MTTYEQRVPRGVEQNSGCDYNSDMSVVLAPLDQLLLLLHAATTEQAAVITPKHIADTTSRT